MQRFHYLNWQININNFELAVIKVPYTVSKESFNFSYLGQQAFRLQGLHYIHEQWNVLRSWATGIFSLSVAQATVFLQSLSIKVTCR